MGHKNREIEKKFTVDNGNLDEVQSLIYQTLGDKNVDSILHDASRDYYWDTPKGLNADFIRLRIMPDDTAQLTLKHTDKGDNTDRIEIDVPVGSPDQGRAFLNHLIGESTGSVYKEYYVFFLDKRDTTVSVYRVRGDKRIFVEIEARSLERVEKLVERVGTTVVLNPEARSLYQIFIQKKE